MREIPKSEAVDAVLKKAEGLRRIDPEEFSDTEGKMPPQFGNNFYLLFKARKFRDILPPETPYKRIYLDKAEALGEPWQRFQSENAQLLAELDEALTDEDIYSDILRLFRDFYAARDFDGGDAYDKRFHSELGIDAIAIPIWQRLNELLQQAAEAMQKGGINPRQFYG